MKKSFAIIMCCLCVLGIFGIESGASNAPESDVIRVDIDAGGPLYLDHQNYDYTTSSKNEITYILNYINSFTLEDDGRFLTANDVSSYSVKIYMMDGSAKKCGFSCGRFYDDSDKQYAIAREDYQRFLDFIHALKTEKIVLEDEVTVAPSEWAKVDIETALDEGLLPARNQINYKGKINRLEVCQLIDNLLERQGVVESQSTENPFSDTTDTSVLRLYHHGMIHGKNDSEFYPYDFITREELARVLSNTYYFLNKEARSDNHNHEYADQAEISDWALGCINDMYSLKIMIGNSENEFKPHANVTKEELIITLLRICR